MANKVQCLVVGAGAVGLAVSRALSLAGYEVLVAEKESRIGQGTSSRNSEVIHAGIYYPQGSLKAKLCVEGNREMYSFCRMHGVDHKRCGKLIVATDESQHPKLLKLLETGKANGVQDFNEISVAKAKDYEPQVNCTAALFSASTGIVCSHSYMLALQGEAESNGAVIATNTFVERATVDNVSERIVVQAGGMDLSCAWVINCAGLHAPALAGKISGLEQTQVPQAYFAKGNYFRLQGASPFQHLVYPIPEKAGLGVHATIDLAGNTRFGPDVEWIDSADDYSVDPARCLKFYKEIQKYWPELEDGALVPDYAGIRPKIQKPGEEARDFLIQGPQEHKVKGLINLFGIESPGLTASLPLSNFILDIVNKAK